MSHPPKHPGMVVVEYRTHAGTYTRHVLRRDALADELRRLHQARIEATAYLGDDLTNEAGAVVRDPETGALTYWYDADDEGA